MLDHSKEELKAFNPKDPANRRRLWVRVVTPDNVWYHVFWGRIVLTVVASVVALWLLLAAGVWGFVRFGRGYADVNYFDLALYPIRKDEYRAGIGKYYLQRGREELMEKKNLAEAYKYLQAGLDRVPNDVTSRRFLASIQYATHRYDLAIATLTTGASLASADLEYFKLLFSLLLERQEDARLVGLAKKLLPATPDNVLEHQYIALQLAIAHFERGRYDEAELVVENWHLEKSLEGSILLAKIDWERGYPDLAMVRLEGEIARFPKRDELYLALVRYHRELAHAGEARRYALLRHFNDPASPGPRIDVLHTYRSTGDKAGEQREIDTYLKEFSADSRALILLAGYAADTSQPDLATRIRKVAVERGYPPNPFIIAEVHALLGVQHYQTALELVIDALRDEGDPKDFTISSLHGLRVLALYGIKDGSRAELMLNAFLGRADLRANDALHMAKQLRLLGATPGAHALLERALVVEPLDQAALAELIRIDAETGNRESLAANLPRYLKMRKPSRALLQEVLLRLDQAGDGPLRDPIRAALDQTSGTRVPVP